jgi:hypothetical protein
VTDNDERKLAIFSFRASNQKPYEGAMWLVNGQLSSLEFNNVTEHVLEFLPEDVALSICV